MPRIPNNLCELAIGMLDAGMSTEHVARHVECSSRAIRNIRIGFRTTGSTNDLPRRGRPRIISHIMNKHLRKLPLLLLLTHLGFIIAESVRNGLHARRPYVGCVLTQRHHQNRLNWARVHTRWIRRHWNTVIFFE